MARLTEEMVIARSKQSDLSAIKKLNCWGAELGDVSLLRRMPNVEVLALSINKIRTLGDFAGCRRLRELYVRKNEISDLHEIRHLRHLPDLTSLWLDENPCTSHPQYRMTVLRNLPNLEKLDNVPVQPDEVQEAMRRGIHIPDSDDEGYPQQQESYGGYRQRSCESSPERSPDQFAHYSRRPRHECPRSPPRRAPPAASPDADERYDHPAMTRSHIEEYSYSSNGECRYPAASGVASPPCPEPYYERPDRSESLTQPSTAREWEYPSAVMAEHRGFTRRPVARNSNLLSAVLCLVKELDYPSLEVAEMAVRCRMDELANSQ
ncbi:cilia- and flagella-associated protein 410 isoform X9 [Helicoverpa zea]|uniref:cilia- and flagella-associated protein 410 isoform X9 n=1 Tax=Helicoverpa zea TaxID=7113 RepID=UPI001F587A7B|nr:cilia- and flagella-associated protein 410 isoform X9 [Helicoverpa zea]